MTTFKQLEKTYLTLLKEFVSFKTVSTDPSFALEMKKAVSWLSRLFRLHGFSVTLLEGKNANPVVLAKYVQNKKVKTILVYGHYDVQPASRSDGWKTDPFVLTKKGDRFVARGAVDNKGQVLAHMVSVFDAIKGGSLNVNVTFLIEGNEESGNPDLLGLLKKHKKDMAPDLIMVSDGEMVGLHPTIDSSFRGGGNIRIVLETSSNDRHSGIFGGAIPNAALEIASLVSKLKENNIVAVRGFYDGLEKMIPERAEEHRLISGLQQVAALAGVRTLLTEPGNDPCTQTGMRPTIEISGIASGYTGNGFKNIVPGKAEARLNVRTVHPQDTGKIMKSIRDFLLEKTPSHAAVSIEIEPHCDPILIDSDHEDIAEIKVMLEKVHGRRVFHRPVGGSVPVVGEFRDVFQKPIALVSLCNDDCNMHGVDENFSSHHMSKAIEFTYMYWNSFLK